MTNANLKWLPLSGSSFTDATDTDELWDSGVSNKSIKEKATSPAVEAVNAMDYRKLFTLSVDTPSFYPQVQRAAIVSTSQERDEDDAQLVRIII